MLVAKGHEVGGDGGVVGVDHSGRGEGARDEFARGWVGGVRRLVWVEGTAVVFGGAELISEPMLVAVARYMKVHGVPAGRELLLSLSCFTNGVIVRWVDGCGI